MIERKNLVVNTYLTNKRKKRQDRKIQKLTMEKKPLKLTNSE